MVFYSPKSNFYNYEFVIPMAFTKYYVKVMDKYNNTIVNMCNNGIRSILIIIQFCRMAGEDFNLASITKK